MPFPADEDQEEAARIFEQYDLLSAAVIDDAKRLVGVLTIDDVVDVINQEADEDIKRLGGVGDEELSDSVWDIARSRVPVACSSTSSRQSWRRSSSASSTEPSRRWWRWRF